MMGKVARKLLDEGLWWCLVGCAILYALLHLLLLAALLTFGQRTGGYPLQSLAIGVYGLIAIGGIGWAFWSSLHRRMLAVRSLPLIILALFLSIALSGAFFATEALGGLGLRTEFAPYLDDDGVFALMNFAAAFWVVALALAARWRGLLAGGMAAQGLALLLNPGFLLPGLLHGLYPEGYPFLGVPALYFTGALVLGWRPALRRRLPVVLIAVTVLIVALATLGNFATAAFWVFVLGLPFWACWMRDWAGKGEPPGTSVAVGVGLALLAGVALISWPNLGPGGGMGDNLLPPAGKVMGWIGKTVPDDAYGPAGDALRGLKLVFPWLLAATGLLWLATVLRNIWQTGVRSAVRRIGLPGTFTALGFSMLFQTPLFPSAWGLGSLLPIPVQGMAGAIPTVLGEQGLGQTVFFGYLLLGLGLLAVAVLLRNSPNRWHGWLTFGATALAFLASLILSSGLVAGILQYMQSQQQITLPEFRQNTQLRLALSLPLNAAFTLLGWAAVVRGTRAMMTRANPAFLRGPVLLGGVASVGCAFALTAFGLWQHTAPSFADISPRAEARDVPTNHPIIVRFEPGPRNWWPGINATYAETGERIQGSSGGFGEGVWFVPDGGWRPNSRVTVKVNGGTSSRSYAFFFTTAAGPSPEVPTAAGLGPRPTPPRRPNQ